MPDTQTYRVRYTGPAAFAGLVAQTLSGEGLDVTWTPPEEQRGVGEVLDTVTAFYVVMGTEAVRRTAVAKVRERLRGRGTVKDEGSQDHTK